MTTRKKLYGSILSLSLGAALLAGCGASDKNDGKENEKPKNNETPVVQELTPEEGAKLLVWDNSDSEREWQQFVAEKFTEKYGIPVTVEEVEHVEAAGQIEQVGPTGKGADVFHAPHDHVGNMENGGIVWPNQLGDSYYDRFVDAATSGVTGLEHSYGFPMAMETYALYYNKDLVDTPAKTMDELIAQGKDFLDVKNDKYGLMLEPGNFYTTYAFMGGYGGYVFGGENGNDVSDLGLNNEGAIKSGELLKKIHDEVLPLKNEDINGDLIGSLFNDGKVMYRISGPWDIKNHQDAGVDFGIAPLPTLENGKVPTSFSGIKAMYVSSYTQYPKAATLYAEFATSDEMLKKRYEMTGQLPPSKALLEDELIASDELLNGFAQQLEHAHPMPNIAEMQKVWDPMATAYTSIWNKISEPKAAFDNAVSQIKGAIETQKK